MLTHITIKQFLTIESLALDLHDGLTVITGETGAGKSIIMDALQLALGARADSHKVRPGAPRCHIALCFNLSKLPHAHTWLQAQTLDEGDDCIITRTIDSKGKSRSTINSIPVQQTLLREFAPLLLMIQGQHQQQALLKSDTERHYIDTLANHPQLLATVKTRYTNWHEINMEYTALCQAQDNRDTDIALLSFQHNELVALALQPGEWETLNKQHKTSHQAKDLLELTQQALTLLDDDTSQHTIPSLIKTLTEKDTQTKHIAEMLETANIYRTEAHSALQEYQRSLSLSPDALQQLDTRLADIHAIARKHQCEPEALLEAQANIASRLADLSNLHDVLAKKKIALANAEIAYKKAAAALSQSRLKSAKHLNKALSQLLQTLAMEGGEFKAVLNTDPNRFHITGQDVIQFTVSTNPGMPLGDLRSVASGGELSRIALALQVIHSELSHTPTLVFDEVDTGIGGETADTVGMHLKNLSQQAQVLCITHLAQIAAIGNQHINVCKHVSNNTTATHIKTVTSAERVQEIERMLGGKQHSPHAKDHAKAMLAANEIVS